MELWNGSTLWWVIAGTLVALELATGTFYLLMLALGAAAGALAAHLGLGLAAQISTAALVGGLAVLFWHRRRASQPQTPSSSNPDVNLDVGQQVQVTHWLADGRTTVRYRGAEWQARFDGSGSPTPGLHTIRAVEGSCLVLAP
ncbi:NfeD family protein [Kinneretia asaccharophila]|uniref:Membrane protein implicated in regulation of membrane protease activity n=1 Tax=Roseateles asaccharophilus TaxID=582607 RepID=A0A4R6N3N6_9BURK|nr:NfeD family protein [Roseateles asaccharophilus]MDN3544456.1 NfeD family protein [Roseateles asaccharophilus]TDP09779.1 membrane protein implicated in regulation of membrane protease activity [Roseateles asaccharophilus]